MELHGNTETERMSDSELLDTLLAWLIAKGLLQRLQYAHRPDRTHGPTWVMRKPWMIDGGSCEGWSVNNAREALENAMRECSL